MYIIERVVESTVGTDIHVLASFVIAAMLFGISLLLLSTVVAGKYVVSKSSRWLITLFVVLVGLNYAVDVLSAYYDVSVIALLLRLVTAIAASAVFVLCLRLRALIMHTDTMHAEMLSRLGSTCADVKANVQRLKEELAHGGG